MKWVVKQRTVFHRSTQLSLISTDLSLLINNGTAAQNPNKLPPSKITTLSAQVQPLPKRKFFDMLNVFNRPTTNPDNETFLSKPVFLTLHSGTKMKTYLLIACALLGFVTMTSAQDKPVIDTSTFDQKVRPQDDLYRYVNGAWLDKTDIPADKSNYGSFIALADLSQERIKQLIDELQKTSHPEGSDARKIADIYKSFMDTETIEKLKAEPVQPTLKEIANLKDKEELFVLFGKYQQVGVTTPVGFFISQDAKNSTQYLANIAQSGNTLPDRDYYLNDDDKSKSAQAALKTYVAKLFELANLDGGDVAAEAVLKLETKLAEVQWERVKLRDAEKRYNKYPFDKWLEFSSKLDWTAFFKAAGVSTPADLNVLTPSFFTGLETILADTSLEDWQAYLQFHALDDAAPFLSQDFVDAHFELNQKQLAGIPEQQPRWKRAINTVAGGRGGGMMGEAVGKLYVAKHFKPEAKAKMDKLVKNLLASFQTSIDDLAWMTDETKVKAKAKLAMINTKIGYPDKWRDFSGLDVSADSLFTNIQTSQKFEYQRMIDRMGKPVNRDEWGMTPQTVNAYYNPSLNEIVFPAAILQSPFFDLDAPAPLNYGGIGAVIGHEISHAFDDQGSRYDGDGNMKNWWTEKDAEAFGKLTAQLIAQYGDYQPLDGKKVNGQLTLGENIADLSGLEIAHRAYRLSLNGDAEQEVAGWNGDQLFFVGWSRVWQRKYRDAELVRRLLIDPHSPSQFRANGPVTNIDSFYKAFDLKEGDMLFKPEKDRIKIW